MTTKRDSIIANVQYVDIGRLMAMSALIADTRLVNPGQNVQRHRSAGRWYVVKWVHHTHSSDDFVTDRRQKKALGSNPGPFVYYEA